MKKRILYIILLSFQWLISSNLTNYTDTFLDPSAVPSDIPSLDDYDKNASLIENPQDRAIYYTMITYDLFYRTLDLQDLTHASVGRYKILIKDLEDRMNLDNIFISYTMSVPSLQYRYKYVDINRQSLRSNEHENYYNLIKHQYLEFLEYHNSIILLCEKRVDELLLMADERTLEQIYIKTGFKKNVLVMNFSNLSDNSKYDGLSTQFPEMIMNRYRDRHDISIMMSGSIEPDTFTDSQRDINTRLLIDGSYTLDGYNIIISFKVYDVNQWVLITEQRMSCDVRDVECLYDSFLWRIKLAIDPLLSDEEYDDFKVDQTFKEQISSLREKRSEEQLFQRLLEDFVVQKDFSFDVDNKQMDIHNDVTFTSKEFDLAKYPDGIKTKEDKATVLFDFLNDFLSNPYNIELGKMRMDYNNNDRRYIDITIPVTYKIKKNNVKRGLRRLPHNTLHSRKDLDVYEFLYENYLFQEEQIKLLKTDSSEMFPILFFTDNEGNVQKIVIDSWDNKYDDLLFGGYDVSRVQLFSPLLSILQSESNMHLNLLKEDKTIDYKVTMPQSLLNNYTRLTLKMLNREKLDNYLPTYKLKLR